MPDSTPPPASADARPTTTPPPPRASTARTVPMRPASSVARTIQHAPAHVTIPAAVLDCVVAGGLLVLLWGHRLDSVAERILALVGLLAVAGVRVADVLRAIRGGGPPTGAGPALVLLACAQAAGHYLATAWRVAALGALALLVVGAVGCASGPRSTDATVKTVLTVATMARETACGPLLDTYLGRTQPVRMDAPATTVVEVTQRVRDWLCADPLGDLLDVARELAADLTRPTAPSSPTATPPPAPAPPGAPDDAGPPPTAATDAGEVTP